MRISLYVMHCASCCCAISQENFESPIERLGLSGESVFDPQAASSRISMQPICSEG